VGRYSCCGATAQRVSFRSLGDELEGQWGRGVLQLYGGGFWCMWAWVVVAEGFSVDNLVGG